MFTINTHTCLKRKRNAREGISTETSLNRRLRAAKRNTRTPFSETSSRDVPLEGTRGVLSIVNRVDYIGRTALVGAVLWPNLLDSASYDQVPSTTKIFNSLVERAIIFPALIRFFTAGVTGYAAASTESGTSHA